MVLIGATLEMSAVTPKLQPLSMVYSLQRNLSDRNNCDKDYDTDGDCRWIAFSQKDVRSNFVANLLTKHCKASNGNQNVKKILENSQQLILDSSKEIRTVKI